MKCARKNTKICLITNFIRTRIFTKMLQIKNNNNKINMKYNRNTIIQNSSKFIKMLHMKNNNNKININKNTIIQNSSKL